MGLQPNYFESSCINIAFLDFEQTQADKPYHLNNIYCLKYKDLCRLLLNFTRKNKALEVDSWSHNRISRKQNLKLANNNDGNTQTYRGHSALQKISDRRNSSGVGCTD